MAVLKVIEVVGISVGGWEAAARAAVAEASRLVRCSAVVRDAEILEYRLQAKLTFRVENDEEPELAVEAAETILAVPVAGDGEELPPLLERQIDAALEEMDVEPHP
jgi:flavin-binding protein dodecin